MRGSTGKRLKKLGDRSRSKKGRNLTKGYLEDIQNSSTDGETESTRERERKDGTKIGPNGNIPWDEES